MHLLLRTLLVTATLGLASSPVFAAVLWDETISGDLSSTNTSPTVLTISSGTNSLFATSGAGGDLDYFTFTMPAGMTLTSITLVSYSSLDGTAFIGVQSGTTFTVTPGSATPDALLGYTHFGTFPVATVGTNILDDIGTGPGSTGFIPPLPSGSYAFWIQQAGATATTYQMDFQVIPEPNTVALIAGAAALVAAGIVRQARARRSKACPSVMV